MPSGTRIRANSVFGTVSDNPLAPGATTFNSNQLVLMPAVVGNHAIVTLDPLRLYGDPEIVIVTAHSAASTVATIQRGAYGTSAREHPQTTVWVHALIDEDCTEILTSSTRPSDPYRGQMIFETDTDAFVARSTADIWQTVVGLGAWASYTPTLTQSVAVAKTVAYAKFQRTGRLIVAVGSLLVTGSGTATNEVTVSLPITGSTVGNIQCGVGSVYDTSLASMHNGTAEITISGTTLRFRPTAVNAFNVRLGQSNSGFSAGLANGDVVDFCVTYEASP